MRVVVVVVFVFITPFALAQSPILDSLSSVLAHHPQEDTVKVALLNELSLRIFKNQPEKSFDYAQEALALAQQLMFQEGIGEARNNLATYQLMKGNADIAFQEAFEAARIGEQNKSLRLLANSYANLALVYNYQLNSDKARYYLNQALKLNLKLNNTLIGSKVYNTLGLMSLDKKNYDSAMFYFKKSLKIMDDGNETYRVAEVINNIGLIYVRQNKIALALEYYFKSLAAAKKTYNRRAEALALFNIGNTVLSEKKYAEAEDFLLKSLTVSKITREAKILGANYMALGQLKNETGKFDEAHNYLSSFYEMKDSLLNTEKVKKIAELEVRYETEKKELTIQLLERDRKIQLLWANILITVLAFVGILSVVIYYLQQYRERKNRQILNLEIDQLTIQNNELSEKYRNVLAGGDSKITESVDQRLLKKAIGVVENNLSDPLFGVEQMAKELGMSRTNLNRKVKSITGFPPSELIRNIRLRRAAQLLMNQSDSIAQIGFTVGFEDHSYFSKSFKKQFGVTPSEYFHSMGQMTN